MANLFTNFSLFFVSNQRLLITLLVITLLVAAILLFAAPVDACRGPATGGTIC